MKSLSALDYEADNNYTITVRAIDENNFYLDKNFTINVTNMVEDIDGDGTENHYDLDDDNDGFTDLDEITYGSNPLDPQSIPNAEPRDLNSTAVLAFSGKPTSGNDNRGRVQCHRSGCGMRSPIHLFPFRLLI